MSPAAAELGDRLRVLSAHGTVRIVVRCLGRGYSLTGYYSQPPLKYNLSGPDLEALVVEAEDVVQGSLVVARRGEQDHHDQP